MRDYKCPYFKFRRGDKIHCETSTHILPGSQYFDEYVTRYCCNDWDSCPFARIQSKYHSDKYDIKLP